MTVFSHWQGIKSIHHISLKTKQLGGRGRTSLVSSRIDWFTQQIPEKSGLHNETLSEKEKQEKVCEKTQGHG